MVQENELESQSTVSMYKTDGSIHEQERDVSKVWKRKDIKISILGLEHQTGYDALMPLRVMGYDGASYRAQCLEPNVNKCPVITMVLHFGNKKWDKNRFLSECFNIPVELKSYFSDSGSMYLILHIYQMSRFPYLRVIFVLWQIILSRCERIGHIVRQKIQ